MNIVLTGFMGSGKSIVGKKLAERLNMNFIDTDEIIAKDVGMSISKIFKYKGEPYFREVESKAVSLVSLLDNHVIATGGGVPMRTENMDELERNGIIIHLQVSPESVLRRIGHDTSRPLLHAKNPLETARDILQKRKKAYERCTHFIDTDSLRVDEVVGRIEEVYNKEFQSGTKTPATESSTGRRRHKGTEQKKS